MDNSNNKNTVRDIQTKNTSTVTGNKSTVRKETDRIVNISTRDKIPSQTEKFVKKETPRQDKPKAENIALSNKEKTTTNTLKQGQTLGNTVKKENTSSEAAKTAKTLTAATTLGKTTTTASTVGKAKTTTTATSTVGTTALGKEKAATNTTALGRDKTSLGTTATTLGKEKTPVSATTAVGGKEKFSASTTATTLGKEKTPVSAAAVGGKEKFSANATAVGKEKTSVANASEKKAQPPIKETKNTQVPKQASKKEQSTEKSAKGERKPEKAKKAVRTTSIKVSPVTPPKAVRGQTSSLNQVKALVLNGLKILLPVAACVVVIVAIISFVGSGKQDEAAEVSAFNIEPLEENAHTEVNEMMRRFYTALADGDMDTVRVLRDYNDDMDILTYQKKSEFIEAYENVNCYTKAGIEENSYFVYVTYELKVNDDIETRAPGLNAFYVYTKADGNLVIDGRMEQNIKDALILVTGQDDVVDLYNKINVSYNEAVASDVALNDFLEELPQKITTSVGEALAQIEIQNAENNDTPEGMPTSETEKESDSQEQPPAEELQNQVVNQLVKATDTVNVRSSDSEEADKIGKVQPGTEMTRTEIRVNGWSKVIYEGKTAYIKSDYLEVISSETVLAENNTQTQTQTNQTDTPIGTVTAVTNVNVRSKADQTSEKVGTAQAGDSYELLEEQGEWYKIKYKGNVAYVKAEFFQK